MIADSGKYISYIHIIRVYEEILYWVLSQHLNENDSVTPRLSFRISFRPEATDLHLHYKVLKLSDFFLLYHVYPNDRNVDQSTKTHRMQVVFASI